MLKNILINKLLQYNANFAGDVKQNLLALLNAKLNSLGLATKSDLEIQQKLLMQSRERIASLEHKLNLPKNHSENQKI